MEWPDRMKRAGGRRKGSRHRMLASDADAASICFNEFSFLLFHRLLFSLTSRFSHIQTDTQAYAFSFLRYRRANGNPSPSGNVFTDTTGAKYYSLCCISILCSFLFRFPTFFSVCCLSDLLLSFALLLLFFAFSFASTSPAPFFLVSHNT